MPNIAKRTTELLDLWQAGDNSARDRLLEHCGQRLRMLAHRMLRQGFPHVGRWEQTDDVLQRLGWYYIPAMVLLRLAMLGSLTLYSLSRTDHEDNVRKLAEAGRAP